MQDMPVTDLKVEYVGPFDATHVVVNGRQVPFLEATHLGDRVSLSLDHRFGLDLTVAEAEKVVPFLAEVMAVGLGYSCHPKADEEPNLRPVFPRLTELTVTTHDVSDA
jgi:hypothetical protein